MTKGAVRILISPELLIQALHMPKSCIIIDANVSDDFYNSIAFIVVDDGLPSVEDNQQPLTTCPLITYKAEEYIWDWNLPKGENIT